MSLPVTHQIEEAQCRHILSTVLALAVKDYLNPESTTVDNHRSAQRFFFGSSQYVARAYLTLLDMDPDRFLKGLKQRAAENVRIEA
jgi:hypothetical protein